MYMKYVKKIILFIILILVIIILAGIYKFNYLANQPGYDVDGNKIDLTQQKNTIDDNQIGFVEDDQKEQIKRDLTEYMCIGEFCDGSGAYDDYPERGNSFMLPMYSDGGDIGCGMKVVQLPYYTEPKTARILNEAYKQLFIIKASSQIIEDGIVNPVGSYPYIHFKKVSLENGLAKVYLNGSFDYGPGHCVVPILLDQIPALAFQFDTVQTVEIYVNNEIFDLCYFDESDGEGFCSEGPQLWISSK